MQMRVCAAASLPLWYNSTQAAAPQSKMLAANEPSISDVSLCRGDIWTPEKLVCQVSADMEDI